MNELITSWRMYLKRLIFTIVVFVSLFCYSAYASEPAKIHPSILEKLTNENEVSVVVRLKEPAATKWFDDGLFPDLEKLAAIRSESQESVLKTMGPTDFKLQFKYYTINAFSGFITLDGLNKLKHNPNVLWIEKTIELQPTLFQSRERIGADKANNITVQGSQLKGAGQIVCVVDTGIDYTHPNLGGCTQAQFLAGNCNRIPGGYDFCANENCTQEDSDPMDNVNHGTFVAGIIASNHTVYQGIAPEARLLAVKACEDNREKCTSSAIAKAVDWCRFNATALGLKPSVITISLSPIREANISQTDDCKPSGLEAQTNMIKNARNAGFFISAASGNDGAIGIFWPACIGGVTSVGATTKLSNDAIWGNTNRNINLDLLAPGERIFSASAFWETQEDFDPRSGTSMATPHVAGAATLIYQLASLKGISMNPYEVENLLKNTAGNLVYDYVKTKREYPRIDVYRALSSMLPKNQSINISNTGSADLEVNSITDDADWLEETPSHFTGFNKIMPNQSRIVNVTVDPTGLTPGSYSATIFINSNDPDEALVTIPVTMNFTGIKPFNGKTRETYSRSRSSRYNVRVRHGSIAEVDSLDFILDWTEQDVLNITLTSPNGTNYTIGTIAEGFNYTDGHPKILSLKPPALQNGTWAITINSAALNSTGEGEFTLETKPFPSDTTPTTVNFSDVRMNYVNTCGFNDNPGFRILMKGVENASLPTINTSNATDTASKAFLTGLVVPNDKLWLNLPRGQVLIDDNFAQTLTAHILLSSDVELKKSGKPEWLQVINNSYHYWDSIIQNTSYYNKVRNKTDWYYPDFTGQRFIIPKNFTLNGSGCDAFVEKLELSTISNITTAWVDYSDYGLNQSELDDVNGNKISQFLTYINNQSNQLLVPTLNTQVNNNATFSDMRRVIISLGLSQWYKTLPRENLMFNEQIDSENLTIFKLNQSFNKTFWQQQSDQLLFNDNLNLPSGNFSFNWRGGLNLIKINTTVIGNISPDLQQKLDDALNKKSQKVNESHYFSNLLAGDKADLKPVTLFFNTSQPMIDKNINITTTVKNNGKNKSNSFIVYFYYDHVYPNGYVVTRSIGTQTIQPLDPGQVNQTSIITQFKEIGVHDIFVEVDSNNTVEESNEQNNIYIASLDVKTPYPNVTLFEPIHNSVHTKHESIRFNATATDPQQGELGDSAFKWYSNKDGLLGSGKVLYKNLSSGEHIITANATDSDGFSTVETVTVSVLPSFPPKAKILSPVSNQVFFAGQNVYFESDSTDKEDGKLANNSLEWNSSIDGFLGYGSPSVLKNLTNGTHTITLKATDKDNQSDNTTLNITVLVTTPSVNILLPEGNLFIHKAVINFSGNASDIKDGNISSSIKWFSDIDGFLFKGSNFTRKLSVGFHEITAVVQNSFGKSAVQALTIQVLPPQLPEIDVIKPVSNQEVKRLANVTFIARARDFEDGQLTNQSINWSSSVNGLLGTGETFQLNSSNLSVGSHIITATAIDSDNMTAKINVSITVVSASPKVNISDPKPGTVFREGEQVNFSTIAEDFEDGILPNASINWTSSLDGFLGRGNLTSLNNLSKGTHKLTVTAVDSHGIVSNKSVNIVVSGLGQVHVTILKDGSDKKELNYLSAGTQVALLRIPKGANFTSTFLNISGYNAFCLNSSPNTFPTNVTEDTGSNGVKEFTMTGELNEDNSPKLVNLNTTALNDFMNSCVADWNDNCDVPLNFSTDIGGIIQLHNISIDYNIFDIIPPKIWLVNASPNPSSPGNILTIKANVTDNINLTSVNATLNDTTIKLLFNASSGFYEGNLTPPGPGMYNLNISARDWVNLTNSSLTLINVSPSQAELVPSSLVLDPSSVDEFNGLIMNLTISNLGGVIAENFTTEFLVDNVSQENQTLTVNASSTLLVSFGWLARVGSHNITLKVDRGNNISEYNESNNDISTTVSVNDITPPTIISINASQIFAGQNMTIKVNATDNVNVSSVKADVNGSLTNLNFNSTTGFWEGSILLNTAGTYNIVITAEDTSGLKATKTTESKVYPTSADLVTRQKDIRVLQIPLEHGIEAVINVTINNEGGSAASNFNVELKVDGVSMQNKTTSVPALGTNTTQFTWNSTFGNHTLLIVLDGTNLIAESDESNNQIDKNLSVIDITPPEINDIILPDKIYETQSVLVKVNASDNVNVSLVNASLGSGFASLTFNAVSGLWEGSLTAPSAADYSMEVRAQDVADLRTLRQRLVRVYNISPDLTLEPQDITFAPSNISEDNILTINATIQNNGGSDAVNASIELLVDGVSKQTNIVNVSKANTTLTTFSWNATYSNHNLTVRADSISIISESNETNNNATKPVYVADVIPPLSLNVTASPSNWTSQTTHNISWQAVSDKNGIDRYEYQIDYGEFKSNGLSTSFITPAQSNGVHIIYVRAVDTPGNKGSLSNVSIYIDNTPPNTPVIREWHTGGNWSMHNHPFFSWNDPGDVGSGVVNYTGFLDGNKIDLNYTLSYHTDNLTTGTHSFLIYASDALNQNSSYSNNITVYIDTTKPPAPSPLESQSHPTQTRWYSNNTPKYNWTTPTDHSGIEGYYYEIDKNDTTVPDEFDRFTTNNEILINSTGSGLINNFTNKTGLSDGIWYFHIAGKDNAGNVGVNTSHYKTLIDTKPPAILNFTPANNSIVNQPTPLIQADYDDVFARVNVSSIVLKVNDATVTPGVKNETRTSFTPTTALPLGRNNATIIIADNATNSRTFTWFFNITNDPPVIGALECEENATVWQNCSLIQYRDILSRVRANCTDSNNNILNVTFSLKNLQDNNVFFTQIHNTTESNYFIANITDINILDSGDFNLTASCIDHYTNSTNSSVWNVPFGTLQAYQITNVSQNITQNTTFNFSAGVNCVGGECGDVNAILDPSAPAITLFGTIPMAEGSNTTSGYVDPQFQNVIPASTEQQNATIAEPVLESTPSLLTGAAVGIPESVVEDLPPAWIAQGEVYLVVEDEFTANLSSYFKDESKLTFTVSPAQNAVIKQTNNVVTIESLATANETVNVTASDGKHSVTKPLHLVLIKREKEIVNATASAVNETLAVSPAVNETITPAAAETATVAEIQPQTTNITTVENVTQPATNNTAVVAPAENATVAVENKTQEIPAAASNITENITETVNETLPKPSLLTGAVVGIEETPAEEFVIKVVNSSDKESGFVEKEGKKLGKLKKGTHDLEAFPQSQNVQVMKLKRVNVDRNASIGIEDVSKEITFAANRTLVKAFAINPEQLDFETAEVFVDEAKANALFKCKDWNFKQQECNGRWQHIKWLELGQPYSFTITKEDPGFGEGGENASYPPIGFSYKPGLYDLFNSPLDPGNIYKDFYVNETGFQVSNLLHDAIAKQKECIYTDGERRCSDSIVWTWVNSTDNLTFVNITGNATKGQFKIKINHGLTQTDQRDLIHQGAKNTGDDIDSFAFSYIHYDIRMANDTTNDYIAIDNVSYSIDQDRNITPATKYFRLYDSEKTLEPNIEVWWQDNAVVRISNRTVDLYFDMGSFPSNTIKTTKIWWLDMSLINVTITKPVNNSMFNVDQVYTTEVNYTVSIAGNASVVLGQVFACMTVGCTDYRFLNQTSFGIITLQPALYICNPCVPGVHNVGFNTVNRFSNYYQLRSNASDNLGANMTSNIVVVNTTLPAVQNVFANVTRYIFDNATGELLYNLSTGANITLDRTKVYKIVIQFIDNYPYASNVTLIYPTEDINTTYFDIDNSTFKDDAIGSVDADTGDGGIYLKQYGIGRVWWNPRNSTAFTNVNLGGGANWTYVLNANNIQDSVQFSFITHVVPLVPFVDVNLSISQSWITVNFNTPPNITMLKTVPDRVIVNNTFACQANVTDPDNDIKSVNYTIRYPNSTIVLDNINGSRFGDLWNSTILNATIKGVWNCSVTAYDNVTSTNASILFPVMIEKGFVKNGSIDDPFWTLDPNPRLCTALKGGDSCNNTWLVNATGTVMGRWEMFTMFNATQYFTYVPHSNSTKVNVSIK